MLTQLKRELWAPIRVQIARPCGFRPTFVGKGRPLKISLSTPLMIVAWIFMAMGLTLANLDPLVDDSNSWGELPLASAGRSFLVGEISTQASYLSSGHFGAASLFANIICAASPL